MISRQFEVAVSSGKLNVVQRGSGTIVLLVHGFPLDHTMWRFQIEALADHFCVIAPDLRGFGRSPPLQSVTMAQYADDLAELLDSVAPERAVNYCGLSMGGYIGWEFWKRHANRLSSLIACDTHAHADTPAVARARRAMARSVQRDGVQSIVDSMMDRLISPYSRENRPGIVAELRSSIIRTPADSIAAAQVAMADRSEFVLQLSQIEVPVMAIAGRHDAIAPPHVMREMANQIPVAQFLEIPNAGHMAPLENPEAFNAGLIKFLQALSSTP
jgi:pimeloyl-ACP methyl ester carboxylesterase